MMGDEKLEDVGGGDDDDLVTGQKSELPAAPILKSSVQTISARGQDTSKVQLCRKEKRKLLKKLRRKQLRKQVAEAEKLEESASFDNAAEQRRIELEEQIEANLLAEEKAKHDEQEKLWLEREKKAMEDFQRQQEELRKLEEDRKLEDAEEDLGYVDDDGPPEIIWKGNEIIVKKRRVKVLEEPPAASTVKDANRSTSNPLPPQSTAFASHNKRPRTPDVSEHTPMFGTEQDKTHCPFHIKTGVCRFGVRCSRVHVYPDHSFTLLVRNMYTGPGLTWENDEGLEHSDEEVAQHYEEFYEDVHSEYLQFGELVNFKVCKNGSSHLRGNVYVHYRTEAGAQAAYNAMNGRFYAGKQITCEFIGVTRWRVALCGEYMKGHHRPCSHGTACNFLHCFRNPRGEYDWADWDSAPPRYWAAKMAKQFGYENELEQEDDDDFNDNKGRRYGSSESPRWRESRHREHSSRDRHRRVLWDDFENAPRHKGSGRHENWGDHYHSDSVHSKRSSRHRSRDVHYSLSSKEVDERSGWNGRDTSQAFHSSGDEAAASDFYELRIDKGQKQHQSNKTGSPNDDGEFSDERTHGNRQVNTRYRSGSRNRLLRDTEKDSKHRVEHRRSRYLKDSDNRRSLDFRSSRHSSTSLDTDSHTDQIGSETESEAKYHSKKGADISLVSTRTGNSGSGRSFEDGVSSDSDVSRSRKRRRDYHHKRVERKRSTRRKSRNQECLMNESEKDKSPDIHDRWTGNRDS